MGPSTSTDEAVASTELSTTNTASSDADVDGKIYEAYDYGVIHSKAMDDSAPLKGARKDGLQRLGSHGDPDDGFDPRPESVASAEIVENVGGTGQEGDGGDGDGNGDGDGDGTVYKVYKRRWFGLIQLTLLNIVVSWDVS